MRREKNARGSAHNASIAKALCVSASWLESGEGNWFVDLKSAASENNNIIDLEKMGRVPLLTWDQAAKLEEMISTSELRTVEYWVPCPVDHGPRTYALQVRGESMRTPAERFSFEDGDLIFIDPDRQPKNGSFVAVSLDKDKKTALRKLIIEGNDMYLMATNPSWPDKVIKLDPEDRILGIVISLSISIDPQ